MENLTSVSLKTNQSHTDDFIIIGGGIIALAIAIELRKRQASVTILCRDFQESATLAAAGMLAPQAECIPPGDMLNLCMRSREIYPTWINYLETITGLDTGYWQCGILSPLYHKIPGSTANNSYWLNSDEIHRHQPGLNKEIIGGWWYPDDGQVDNQKLASVLLLAARKLGVKYQEGITVQSINYQTDKITNISTNIGKYSGGNYILAAGSWTEELLRIPVFPKKGQMLSVIVTEEKQNNLPIKQVLFGENTYIVPRKDGKIIIGATSENVGHKEGNTVGGIYQLLNQIIKMYPGMKDLKIGHTWWGFRPGTPDEMPILGLSAYQNLILATGHYRNGILLAPITGLLISDLTINQKKDIILDSFSWKRFVN